MPRPARFTIRAACALTGINQNTLRAWERRHALLRPERTPKGYRLYSDEDIERLRLIRRALQEGVSIGRVHEYLAAPGTVERLRASGVPRGGAPARTGRIVEVSLAAAGLQGTTTIRLPAQDEAPNGDGPLSALAGQIEQAALRLERPALERAFTRAVGTHSLREAFHQALAPALARVGQRAVENAADAEQLLAGFAREKLLAALAGLRPLHQQPRALFACVPGDPHEMMPMLLSLEVGLEGVSAHYLGGALSVEAVQQAARAARSRAVALSATLALPPEVVLDARDRLARLPCRPRLLLGGPAAWKGREWLEAHGIEVLSLDLAEAATQVLRAVEPA